jgi:hypothetical protein
MRGSRITACTLVVLGGGVAIAIATDRDERSASTSREGGQLGMAGLGEPGLAGGSQPPRAVVRGCAARISGGSKRRDDDTIVGPLRFNMQSYSPLRAWRQQVRSDQWLKSPARLRAGAQVTLVVPPEQRGWMRLAYAQRRGAAAVTLRACRHRRSLTARRRECVWAEGVVGSPGSVREDYTACRSGPTFFSGGFEIDYDEAPEQGRCAELLVWVKGEQQPHRVRLLRVQPGECASDSA